MLTVIDPIDAARLASFLAACALGLMCLAALPMLHGLERVVIVGIAVGKISTALWGLFRVVGHSDSSAALLTAAWALSVGDMLAIVALLLICLRAQRTRIRSRW